MTTERKAPIGQLTAFAVGLFLIFIVFNFWLSKQMQVLDNGANVRNKEGVVVDSASHLSSFKLPVIDPASDPLAPVRVVAESAAPAQNVPAKADLLLSHDFPEHGGDLPQ